MHARITLPWLTNSKQSTEKRKQKKCFTLCTANYLSGSVCNCTLCFAQCLAHALPRVPYTIRLMNTNAHFEHQIAIYSEHCIMKIEQCSSHPTAYVICMHSVHCTHAQWCSLLSPGATNTQLKASGPGCQAQWKVTFCGLCLLYRIRCLACCMYILCLVRRTAEHTS